VLRRAARPAAAAAPAPVTPLEAELSTLIAPLAEGVLLLDGELRVIAANPAAARTVEQSLGSMAGATLVRAVRDHDLAQVVREAAGTPVLVHLSAAGRDVRATAARVPSAAVHTVLALEDVTDLLRAQRARVDLVGNVSHELRTPIAAARALAETLQSGVDEVEARGRFIDRLADEIGRIERIVERLLRLARLDSGREPFDVRPVAAAALLATAAERVGPIAVQHRVQLEVADGGDAWVAADLERALEVLGNLLDNAIRHSPEEGRVRLEAAAEEGAVRFGVADEGPGILPSDRERVFERFYTGDQSRASGGGTGLGLAIARQIVQRLGGRIWVAEAARGARLCFTLPRVPAATPPRADGGGDRD
jgi:two-component system phosphate regulon sensor histidine kinase PhoR